MSQNGKIKTLEELPDVLASLRAEQKKIVHCHGVFDLLHIGHIRHFEKAKALGDVLVVTVTPDRYVNKGPHRPVFPEELRVEAIGGLNCVDYVAINRWPMAKETIELLRPDIYAKGADYQDASRDRTGGITVEEEAVRAAGGKLVLTEDIVYSSSNLLNQHLPVVPLDVVQYLARFASRYPADEVLGWLERIHPLRVLAIGEAIIDEYQYCEAMGKSSKEPMLAVRHLSTEKFAGGILAAANHAASFCTRVGVVTFLGAENSQEEFIRNRLHPAVDPLFLYRPHSPTIVKRRLIENYSFTKLMEVYEMNGPLEPEDDRQLCATLREVLPDYDLAMVIDYGHDMISEEAVEILCEKARFLAVNAQSNAGNHGYHTISKYPRADYVCMAENEIRLEARDRRGDLKPMVREVARKLRCDRVVVTRGKNGCLTYSAEEGFSEVPALATRVVDRMGAGDSFISVTAPCVYQKAPMELVGFIGNAAGAQAVATVGHRKSTERTSLFRHIECVLK
jgi:rfaE bifunctional protein nucleotidyltransferase chain/domain